MNWEDAIKLLDALANLQLCQKDSGISEEGDVAYYFTLEESICIYYADLNEIFFKLDASDVYVVTDEKADERTHDQLCIYYKKGNNREIKREKASKIVEHIEQHLLEMPSDAQVVCKICDKRFWPRRPLPEPPEPDPLPDPIAPEPFFPFGNALRFRSGMPRAANAKQNRKKRVKT